MSIEIGSKWFDGIGVVEVTNTYESVGHTCIWYIDDKNISHILVDYDFMQQHKPYEPVYEYKYAFIDYRGEAVVSLIYFINEKDFKNRIGNSVKFLQRLDFTKRERT